MSKTQTCLKSILVLALGSGLLFSFASAEPTVGTPIQGHGGNGGNMSRVFSDRELTLMTRAEEGHLDLNNAVIRLRAEVARIPLTASNDPRAIAAKVTELANAEYNLAVKKADAFAALQTQFKVTTPERRAQLLAAMNSVTGRAGRGGRGAAAAPAAAGARGGAPAPGATAPAAPAPAAPARGN